MKYDDDFEYSRKVCSIEEIKNAVKKSVIDVPDVKQVVLFGSYARGEAHEMSDLDILITDPPKLKPMLIWMIGGNVGEILNKPVEIFGISSVRKDTLFYRNIIKEGVVIYERNQNP